MAVERLQIRDRFERSSRTSAVGSQIADEAVNKTRHPYSGGSDVNQTGGFRGNC